jgi:molecular chaperone GrpE
MPIEPETQPESEVQPEPKESEELRRLRSELDEATDQALRSRAELENYRRRMQREMEDERRYANLRLIRDLLPVLDNIERAIDAAQKANESETLLKGFQMVAQQLQALLDQYHCKRIEALYQPFDPSIHDAIAQQPSAEYPPHTVIHVTRNGYWLHDRVVRPSQVVVAAQPLPGSAQGDGRETL